MRKICGRKAARTEQLLRRVGLWAVKKKAEIILCMNFLNFGETEKRRNGFTAALLMATYQCRFQGEAAVYYFISTLLPLST
jgi:hypothetical protein